MFDKMFSRSRNETIVMYNYANFITVSLNSV